MALVLHTTHGDLPILLWYKECPKAAFNFLALCASGYYDACAFYRHYPGILLQTGDPTNSGKGGESIFTHAHQALEEKTEDGQDLTSSIATTVARQSRYFEDEGFGTTHHHQRGVLSMAHKGSHPNTNASQFLVLCSPQPSFDGMYTAFGQIDLNGYYDASGKQVMHNSDERDRTGEAVLQSLEAAAAQVDAKYVVKNQDNVRIIGVTVLYNPFAEGKMKL